MILPPAASVGFASQLGYGAYAPGSDVLPLMGFAFAIPTSYTNHTMYDSSKLMRENTRKRILIQGTVFRPIIKGHTYI